MATPATVAEFLTHCFEVRGAMPGTILGYKSAIAAKIRLAQGVDIGNHPMLKLLMRSFFVARPLPDRSVIKWDIKLVLENLKVGRFGHTDALGARELTLKCVFLMALATGKRRGELHALANVVNKLSDDWRRVELVPVPKFVGKTHYATGGTGTISSVVVQSLEGLEGRVLSIEDKQLCPVYTLRRYRKVSDEYRSPTQKRLFITYVPGRSQDISKQTVSNYIRLVVAESYTKTAQSAEALIQCSI